MIKPIKSYGEICIKTHSGIFVVYYQQIEYWENGFLHNPHGPAVELVDGLGFHYLNGRFITHHKK